MFLSNTNNLLVTAIKSVCKNISIEFYSLTKKDSPLLTFESLKPELFICDISKLDRATAKAIQKHNTPVVLLMNEKISSYYIDIIDNIILEIPQNPRYGDVINFFYTGDPDPRFICDEFIISHWFPKDYILEQIKSCRESNCKLKVAGTQFISEPEYIGVLKNPDYRVAIRSASHTLYPVRGLYPLENLNIELAGGKPICWESPVGVRKMQKSIFRDKMTSLHLVQEILGKNSKIDSSKEIKKIETLLSKYAESRFIH